MFKKTLVESHSSVRITLLLVHLMPGVRVKWCLGTIVDKVIHCTQARQRRTILHAC